MEPLPVTVVIINFRTPDLVSRAVGSLRRYYPSLAVLLIDNGSGDRDSLNVLESNRCSFPECTTIIVNPRNRHHGPAMDQALHETRAPYVLFLDSDCEVVAGGFIENMLNLLCAETERYAIGKKTFLNRRGFDVSVQEGATPYIRPICMMVKRELYLRLPPFKLHGSPCLENMRQAKALGFTVVDFPVERYVRHEGRGTAGHYGYRLGLRGKINFILDRIGF
jgi:glycosyltransferase involved in cell wall biosynthesis